MVTKKELTDFKKTLSNALQKAGYTAYGRIPSSEEIYNFYAHLPEQEMVSLYVEDNNLDVENLSYIDKTGERRKTQYHWIHEEEPSFKAAKDFVEHMRKLKLTKLSKALKKTISKAVADGISKEEFFKANKIKKRCYL